MMPADFNFGAPWWLWGLAAIPLLLVLFWWAERQAARRLRALLPAPRLRAQLTGTASVSRRRWRYAFLLLALGSLLAALAQPRWGYEILDVHRRGLDVIVVVDVSKSMLATDVAPSRLVRAKLTLHDMLMQLDGDRVGLVAFAGSAFLQAPLTIDYDAVLGAVDELDTDLIPMGGTNIGAGISLALEAFGKAEAGNRAILLISDGEPTADSDQADGEKAASRAAEQGVKVFTMGFGTPEGSLIPLGAANHGELVHDADGQLVRTRLDENVLRGVAQAGGGFYVRFENGGAALRTVVQDGLSRLKTAEIDARTSRRPIERYQWPLAVALAALSLGMLLGERRKSRAPAALPASPGVTPRRPRATAAMASAVAGLWLGLAGALSSARAADDSDPARSNALDLYRDGRYDQAYSAFENLAKRYPKVDNLQFDAGASAYMAKQYEEALDAFSKSLTSNDPSLQAKSHYNFGNSLFRRGEQKKDRQEKISDWRNAIQHYDSALNAIKSQPPQPNDTLARDTAYNRDLVQHRIDEELKQPPQPQDKQDKQDKSDQPKDQKQNGQGNPQSNPDQPPKPQPKPQEGKQDKQDQSSSSSQDQSQQQQQPGQNQPGQSGKQDGSANQPPEDQSGQSQTGQRPDPSSVPNQDKPRQRGDFKAQPAKPDAGETPPDQSAQEPAEEKGKMSPDQARALLQSLKDEDTNVNLNDDPETRRDEPVLKDW